jgi:hypothetical protein
MDEIPPVQSARDERPTVMSNQAADDTISAPPMKESAPKATRSADSAARSCRTTQPTMAGTSPYSNGTARQAPPTLRLGVRSTLSIVRELAHPVARVGRLSSEPRLPHPAHHVGTDASSGRPSEARQLAGASTEDWRLAFSYSFTRSGLVKWAVARPIVPNSALEGRVVRAWPGHPPDTR